MIFNEQLFVDSQWKKKKMEKMEKKNGKAEYKKEETIETHHSTCHHVIGIQKLIQTK